MTNSNQKKETKCENCKRCKAELFYPVGIFNKEGVKFRALCKRCYYNFFGDYEGDKEFFVKKMII